MKYSRNPLTGQNCSGYRFQFKVPSIYPHTLYLPLEMKDHPSILKLLQGVNPIDVFVVETITDARSAFRQLRKRYDFDYWAIKEYYIHDIANPDSIVPLRLNDFQFNVIDILRKRYFKKEKGRYVISKSIRRCGLSTCIQAYILWSQTNVCRNNSYICGPSEIAILPLKKNICRHLHRDIVPQEPWIFIPRADGRTFFNTFRNPDFIRGINLGYVHYANMSQWKDPENKYTSRAFVAAVCAVLLDYFTLVVLEGDIPRKEKFNIKDFIRNHGDKLNHRKKTFSCFTSNPFFLNEVIVSMTHRDPHFFHIHISRSICSRDSII